MKEMVLHIFKRLNLKNTKEESHKQKYYGSDSFPHNISKIYQRFICNHLYYYLGKILFQTQWRFRKDCNILKCLLPTAEKRGDPLDERKERVALLIDIWKALVLDFAITQVYFTKIVLWLPKYRNKHFLVNDILQLLVQNMFPCV